MKYIFDYHIFKYEEDGITYVFHKWYSFLNFLDINIYIDRCLDRKTFEINFLYFKIIKPTI